MRRPLILVGGGGHCRSVIEAARSAGYEFAGILDMPELAGSDCLGIKVVGTDDDIPAFVGKNDFVVTLGQITDSSRRRILHQIIIDAGGTLATVIAGSACVSPYSQIGPGTVVLHNAVVNAGAETGTGCIINTSAIVEHDCRIGDYTHISTGAIVNGGCTVGDECLVGSGTVVRQGTAISSKVIVGASSLVTRDLGRPGIYFGVPARFRR